MSTIDSIDINRLAPGTIFVTDETIRLWQFFYHENKYIFGGLYIQALVSFLELLAVGLPIEEIEPHVKNFEFNNTLMNGICVALLKFSPRGREFFDNFYVLDIPIDFQEKSLNLERKIAGTINHTKFYSNN